MNIGSKRISRRSFLSLPALLPLSGFGAVGKTGEHVFQYDHVIGTSLDLVVWTAASSDAERVANAVLDEIDRLALILNTRDPESEIRQWERTPDVVPSTDLRTLLSAYRYWEARTQGIIAARPHGRESTLNVDALGKAYILDRAAEAARRAAPSMNGFLLNIGGDIVVWGHECELGITNPYAPHDNSDPIALVRVRNSAVAASGAYARGAHLVDARTGLAPARVASATVLAPDAVTANALATAICVVSPVEGMQLTEGIERTEAMRIGTDGAIHRTSGFSRFERPHFVRTALTAPDWPAGYQLTVSLTLTEGAPSGGGRRGGFGGRGGGRGFAQRPYVAVWIENDSGKPIRVLAFWANKPRYFAELDSFYNLVGRNQNILYSMARATRPPGSYQLVWDGMDEERKPAPAGTYRVVVETNQEHGTYAKRSGTMDCGAQPSTATLGATANFEAVTIQFGPKQNPA